MACNILTKFLCAFAFNCYNYKVVVASCFVYKHNTALCSWDKKPLVSSRCALHRFLKKNLIL